MAQNRVLDLQGLLRSKQGLREKDKADRCVLELALARLREVPYQTPAKDKA